MLTPRSDFIHPFDRKTENNRPSEEVSRIAKAERKNKQTETERRKRVHSVSLSLSPQKKKKKQNIFLFLFFSPSLATTKNKSAIGSRKEKGKNIFPLSLIYYETKRLQTGGAQETFEFRTSKDDIDVKSRHLATSRATSR